MRDLNQTKLRIYKYIFRGEIIPSTNFVKKLLHNYDNLPCYLSIMYLDEEVSKELKNAYSLIKD